MIISITMYKYIQHKDLYLDISLITLEIKYLFGRIDRAAFMARFLFTVSSVLT